MISQKIVTTNISWKQQIRTSLAILGILIMTFTTSGCQVQLVQPISQNTERLEANKAVVLRVFDEAFTQGNLEIVDELYAEDVRRRKRYERIRALSESAHHPRGRWCEEGRKSA